MVGAPVDMIHIVSAYSVKVLTEECLGLRVPQADLIKGASLEGLDAAHGSAFLISLAATGRRVLQGCRWERKRRLGIGTKAGELWLCRPRAYHDETQNPAVGNADLSLREADLKIRWCRINAIDFNMEKP